MGQPKALFGDPPASDDDLYFVTWLIDSVSTVEPVLKELLDPHEGFTLFAQEPPGYVHESRRPQLMAAAVVNIIVIVALLVIRLSVFRLERQVKWWWHDTIFVFASFVGFVYTVYIGIADSRHQNGLHIWETYYYDYGHGAHFLLIGQMGYYFTHALLKLSISLFIYRIVSDVSQGWRLFSSGLITICVLFCFAPLITFPLALGDPSSCFNVFKAGKEGRYITVPSYDRSSRATSITNATIDLLIAMVPVVLFRKSSMSRGKRIRLSLLFMLGVLTMISSVMICVFFGGAKQDSDPTWNAVKVRQWQASELALSFIVACMPALNTIFLHIWPEKPGQSSRSGQLDSDKLSDGNRSDQMRHSPEISPVAEKTQDHRVNITRVDSDLEMGA